MSPFFLNLSLLGSARMLEFAPSSQKRGSWELISSTFRFWRKETLRRFSIRKKHLGPNEKNPVGSMPWSSCFDMLCGGLRYDPLFWVRKGCQHRKKKRCRWVGSHDNSKRRFWPVHLKNEAGVGSRSLQLDVEHLLVGGFNTSEKILVKVGIFPK